MDLLTITHFLNWLLMIAIPIVLGIYLTEKFHTGWRIWLIGAATFIISQLVHIPFNLFVLNPLLAKIQSTLQEWPALLIISTLLGLSAGVFEETARYGMFRWWIKDSRTWRSAILAGAGHGGIEAILFGLLAMLQFLNLVAYRNIDLTKLNLSMSQLSTAQLQFESYWNLPWYVSLLGAVERAFSITIQISLSVIVLQVFRGGVRNQRLRWLGLAIFYHTLIDGSMIIILKLQGIYVTEAVIGFFAILGLIIIFALRSPEPEELIQELNPPHVEQRVFKPTQVEETSDNLENTRYQ